MRDTFFPATQRRRRFDVSFAKKKRNLRGMHVCSGARAKCEYIRYVYWSFDFLFYLKLKAQKKHSDAEVKTVPNLSTKNQLQR